MRRFATIASMALLVGIALPQTVSADTGPQRSEIEFDRVSAEFAFTDAGRDFVGQILIQRDAATGSAITSFFYFSGVIVVCDNGTPDDPSDDFEAQDLIDFTANETSPTTLSIDDKLRAASAAGVGTGQLTRLEACTNVQTSTTETVPWALDLTGVGTTTHTTQVDRFPNDDGTVTKQTIKIEERPAGGTVAVGDRSVAAEPAAISHTLIVETTN